MLSVYKLHLIIIKKNDEICLKLIWIKDFLKQFLDGIKQFSISIGELLLHLLCAHFTGV